MRLSVWILAAAMLSSGDLTLAVGAIAAVMLWELTDWAAGGSEGF